MQPCCQSPSICPLPWGGCHKLWHPNPQPAANKPRLPWWVIRHSEQALRVAKPLRKSWWIVCLPTWKPRVTLVTKQLPIFSALPFVGGKLTPHSNQGPSRKSLSPWGNYDSHNRSGGWRTERRGEEKRDRNKAGFIPGVGGIKGWRKEEWRGKESKMTRIWGKSQKGKKEKGEGQEGGEEERKERQRGAERGLSSSAGILDQSRKNCSSDLRKTPMVSGLVLRPYQ